MAREFGWTLDYIDALPYSAFEEYMNYDAVLKGVQKANDYLRREREAHKFRGT